MLIDGRLQNIEIAMGKFAEAMLVYAQHLQSHTAAVISLAEAAKDLKKSVMEHDKVISELTKVVKEMNVQRR